MKFNFSPIQKTPSSRLTIPSYRSEVPFVCKYGQIFQFDGQIWYNPIFDSWKDKNGYKPSKHGLCSRFLFRNDMCYIMIFLI